MSTRAATPIMRPSCSPTSPSTTRRCDQLSAQLVQARDVALRYPTVADAEAGGYRLAGGFAPLVGADIRRVQCRRTER